MDCYWKLIGYLISKETIKKARWKLQKHAGSWFKKILQSGVVYWPTTRPNMPFQSWRKCIFHWRGRASLTIWDWVKIPGYSHKLMHRKRVTCELHDSFFRSMAIKHAIPKTAEVWRRDAVEKTSTQRGWATDWAAQENRKEMLTAIKRRSICCSSVRSPTLSLTHNPFNKVRGIFFLRNCVIASLLCWNTTTAVLSPFTSHLSNYARQMRHISRTPLKK